MKLAGFVIAALLLVPFAHADGGPVNMVFTGVNGANDGQYYVSPYIGTMNDQTVVLFCDDIKNEVTFGQQWQANVTNLGTAISTSNFTNTRYGGVSTSAVYGNPTTAYSEVSWLTTQFASHTNDFVSLQYAMWDIMNPGSEPTGYGDVQMWLNQAQLNFGSIDPSKFEIVTNTGNLQLTGQVQEFIVQTPEPGVLALLICGLLALAVRLNRGRLTA
ncbi:MAG TPA: hypothetical protein VGH37_13400 [Candidatus Acidoferrum sp.]|jgi:hypothetical protein